MNSHPVRWAALTASLLFGIGAAQAQAVAAQAAPVETAPAEAAPAQAVPVEAARGYSAAGSYNLANAYARQGKIGMAVLNYERARLLSASDADLDANLNYVRASAHLPVPPRNAFDRAARMVNPFAAAWIGIVGLMIAGVCAVSGQFSSSSRRPWLRRLAAVVGIAMFCLPFCNGIALWPLLHEGIVISAATPVRVSPVPMGDSLFVLPEAEAVSITAEHEGFLLIETTAGRSGWVSRANVASVVPRR
jgi:hypothetical protein